MGRVCAVFRICSCLHVCCVCAIFGASSACISLPGKAVRLAVHSGPLLGRCDVKERHLKVKH